ncbi:MAG: hypothetical protein Q8N98_04140, partial [bacterium]|nr:hypothetical protein [bacterium]
MMEKFLAHKRKIAIIFLLGLLSFSLPIAILLIKEQTRSTSSATSPKSNRSLPEEKETIPCPESNPSCEDDYDTLEDANGCTYYRCKGEYPILIDSGISITDKSLVTLSLTPEKKYSRFLASNDSGFRNVATFSAIVNEADQLLGGPTGMIWAIAGSPDI